MNYLVRAFETFEGGKQRPVRRFHKFMSLVGGALNWSDGLDMAQFPKLQDMARRNAPASEAIRYLQYQLHHGLHSGRADHQRDRQHALDTLLRQVMANVIRQDIQKEREEEEREETDVDVYDHKSGPTSVIHIAVDMDPSTHTPKGARVIHKSPTQH